MNLPDLGSSLSAFNDVDSRLAIELAINMSEPEDILARYGLSATELKDKLKNPHFSQMVKEFKTVWNSDLSTKERTRIKSMALVEDSLMAVHGMVHDMDIAPTARMDAFKSLAKVATLDAPDKDGQAVGERINININIPGAEKPVTYEGVAEVKENGREAITDGA